MKVIEPSFTELKEDRLFQKIELCGRVCYKSEDKITDSSALNFVKRICVNHHGSVLEHYAFLFRVSESYYDVLYSLRLPFFTMTKISSPLISFNLRAFLQCAEDEKYEEALLPFERELAKAYPDLFQMPEKPSSEHPERIMDFSELNAEEMAFHRRVTIKLITDRGVTHELVRHRLASFSQESTRYCNYGKDKFGNEITLIRPSELTDETYPIWEAAMKEAEKSYFQMLEKGASPQIARSVLPNSLKTELVITADLKEWKLIFDLRCAPQAHPDVRILMQQVKDYFIEKGYLHDSDKAGTDR